jgi:hypothetical protein
MRGSLALVQFLGGLLILFIGEVVIGPGSPVRTPAAVLAAVLLLAALGGRLQRWSAASGETRAVLGRLLPAYGAALLGVALYGALAEGSPVGPEEGDLTTVLKIASLLLLLGGTLPLILMESSLSSMYGAVRLESRRMVDAGRAGLAIALALGALGLGNYWASDADKKMDMRLYRILVPSEATLEMVRNLSEPVEITLFFPPGNDVHRTVAPYFEELADASDQLTVVTVDRDMNPALAKELRARKNGTVVVSQGDSHESIRLDIKPDRARTKIKKLDGDFAKKLGKITREQTVAYFVIGHGERMTSPRKDDLPGLKAAKELLQRWNFKVKKLGPREGLGNQVPDDATIVFLVGPQLPLLEPELVSLVEYVQGGGALFVLIDPEVEEPLQLDLLLTALGVTVSSDVLTHDRKFFPFRGALSDRQFLITTRFGTHDSTTVLSRISNQVAVFTDASGSVDKLDGSEVDVQFTVRSVAGTWADVDGDLEWDKETEKKRVYQLVAAVQLPEQEDGSRGGRAIVTADADIVADTIMARSKGNRQWLHDAVRWLEDDIQLIGEVADIEDVPIVHSAESESLWFWGTTFGIPFLVFGLGFGIQARRRNTA